MGLPVVIGHAVAGVAPLVQDCNPFMNGLPNANRWPVWRNHNRVAREWRGSGGGIVVVCCLINCLADCEDLLGCLWSRQVFLLGVSRQSKADCQSYERNY